MKLFNLIATSVLGAAMAIGSGVALANSQKEVFKTNAADSGLSPSNGVFIIDFYDSTKISSTTGTTLSNSNYSDFVKVASGLTKTNVVTGVSVSGTVQYGKNGGLTLGANNTNAASATFTIGADYAVNKISIYGAKYDSNTLTVGGSEADSGTIADKGTTFNNISAPLVWNNLNGITSIVLSKTSGKRVTAYTLVCEYTASAPETHYISSMSAISSTDPLSVEDGVSIDTSLFTLKGTKDGVANTTLDSSEYEFLGSGVKTGDVFTPTSTSQYTLGDNYLGWVSKLDTSNSDTTKQKAFFPVTVTAVEQKKFMLIKDVSSLEAGSKIIIGNGTGPGEVKFLSTTQNENNRSAVTKTTEVASGDAEASITFGNSTVEVLTVGGSEGHWTLQPHDGGYLYAASSSANYLRTQATNNTNGQWAISIASSGEATIIAQGSNTRNSMRFNGDLVACYATGQSAPYIYQYQEPIDTNKILDSLSVTGTATKMNYVEGQTFDPTGLTIEAVFTDSVSYPNEDVTSLVSWSELEVGDTSVTGSYTHQGVTKQCTINGLTVVAKSLSSVTLSGASGASGNNKFTARQAFNITGVTITARYDNGTNAVVAHDNANLKFYLDDVEIALGYVFKDSEASDVAENHTIKVTYTDGGVTKYATYKISVSAYVNPIQAIYSKEDGAAVDVYGVYVGFLDGTGPVIMDGDYGIVVYNKTADVSGYTEGSTVLHVTGNVSIYKGLYEIGGTVSISVAAGDYTAPAAPVVYATQGGETADFASRMTTVSGVPSVTSGSLDAEPDTSDIKMTFTVGLNSIQVFYKKAAQNAEDMALLKAAVEGSDEITIKGFTSWHEGFQVQMSSVVPAIYSYTAEDFAQDLLDQTDAVCAGYAGENNHDALVAIWSNLAGAGKYPSLPSDQKTILGEADADESGTVVEQAMARYDYLTAKYNLSNFIVGRTPVSGARINMINVTNNTVVIAVVVTTMIAMASVGVFSIVRRRKHQ